MPRLWRSIPAHCLIPASRPDLFSAGISGLTLRSVKSQMAQDFRVHIDERREAQAVHSPKRECAVQIRTPYEA